ncbi:helix-turn-helix domain-containing protein [Ferroacidibacillus organovorans]|uniref:HTH cro/C1-type domain-containing protein n=1 Tax=Ferroacidibacillus organovorans TaxID=1765683 RepID=A0A117SY51_9BACL|nr:helix-turn-helix transcriptional regulator [Ferroacidibacillus organovorans]KUO96456.1 hypothetical protein ATW55_01035 [Ferroacidibacillus organovorans]
MQFDGSRLKALRLKHGYTLADLSVRSGVSLSHISQLEKGGRKSPSIDYVYRLAEALSVSMYDLLQQRDAPFPELIDNVSIASESAERAWDRFSQTLRPDALQFILSPEGPLYIAFAMRLRDVRKSPQLLLRAVHEFLESENL